VRRQTSETVEIKCFAFGLLGNIRWFDTDVLVLYAGLCSRVRLIYKNRMDERFSIPVSRKFLVRRQ
jgi:hypothetical protein